MINSSQYGAAATDGVGTGEETAGTVTTLLAAVAPARPNSTDTTSVSRILMIVGDVSEKMNDRGVAVPKRKNRDRAETSHFVILVY